MSQDRHKKLFKSTETVKYLQFYRLASHLTVENQRVVYHFTDSHNANIFLNSAKSKFWARDPIQKTKIATARCSHAELYQRCITVALAPTQFDTLVMKHGYEILSKLNDALNRSDSNYITSTPFTHRLWINQATLLVSKHKKEANIFHFLMDTSFDNFISHVEEDILHQILKLKFKKESLVAANQYFLAYLMFDVLKKTLNQSEVGTLVTDQIMSQKMHHAIAMQKLAKSVEECLVTIGADKLNAFAISQYDEIAKNPFILNYLLPYLTDNTINNLALHVITKNNIYINDMASALFSKPEKLNPELLGILYYLKNRFFYRDNDHKFYVSKASHAMFEYAEKWKDKIKDNSLLKSIDFYDGATSRDDWSSMAYNIVADAPPVTHHKLTFSLQSQIDEVKCEKLPPTSMIDFCHGQLKFHQLDKDIYGQLNKIILKDSHSQNMVILRFQGKDESIQTLVKEYKTAHYLKNHAEDLALHSFFPEPLGVTQMSGVKRWIKEKIAPAVYSEICDFLSDSHRHGVYISQINKENEKYLEYVCHYHDFEVSEKEYNEINRVIVNDLFTLLKQGMIINPLANLLHNTQTHAFARIDKGHYFVLADLIRHVEMGSGRLDNWKFCVSWFNSNIRRSGLMDLYHHISFQDLMNDSPFMNKYHEYALNVYHNDAINFVLANVIAEYQYVLFLLAGIRGSELTNSYGQSEDEIHAIWQGLAKLIIQNCAQGASFLTQKPEHEIEKILSIFIDVDRLARQMRYWMNNEYISDIMQNKVKEGIYPKDTKVQVDFRYFKKETFNETAGFSYDGVESDLGTFNGQEPIKEANKLFYFMVIYIFTQYSRLHLTLSEVHHLKPDDPTAFKHLFGKSYHRIHKYLCQERLLQKKIMPDDIKENIQKALETHKREEAAYTIAHFWRKHKNYKSKDVEMKKDSNMKM